jgi:acetyl esterase/lipase
MATDDAGLASTDDGGQDPQVRKAIVGLGHALGPDVLKACGQLFREEQLALAMAGDRIADLPYGPAPRQQLDLYPPVAGNGEAGAAAAGKAGAPVLLWVHGGGFVRGEKFSPELPYNAHMGRFAARHGLLGAVMNYRLAPEHRYPSGGEDVGLAIDCLRREARARGGDPERIFAVGTSAGAVHVATHLMLRAGHEGLHGAALFSGLYGTTPLEPPDLKYYGEGASASPGRAVLEAVAATRVPLFVACAEFDPPRFQAETMALLQRRFETRGHLPRAHLASGHNHYSLAMHVGGRDQRLGRELLGFITETCHDQPTG